MQNRQERRTLNIRTFDRVINGDKTDGVVNDAGLHLLDAENNAHPGFKPLPFLVMKNDRYELVRFIVASNRAHQIRLHGESSSNTNGKAIANINPMAGGSFASGTNSNQGRTESSGIDVSIVPDESDGGEGSPAEESESNKTVRKARTNRRNKRKKENITRTMSSNRNIACPTGKT